MSAQPENCSGLSLHRPSAKIAATMVLYLVAAMPLIFAFVAFLPWSESRAPHTLALMATFLKGALVFLPAYLVILLLRAIFGFSYDGVFFCISRSFCTITWCPCSQGSAGFFSFKGRWTSPVMRRPYS